MSVVPSSIENHATSGVLALGWEDGTAVRWTHAGLRAACPCAECRARRRAGLAVAADAQLRIVAIEQVGAYALNLVFADGHRRGIYPYTLLAQADRAGVADMLG